MNETNTFRSETLVKKIRCRTLFFTILLAPLLTNCIATEQNVKTLDLKIRTIDNRLINIDRDLSDLKDVTGGSAKKDSLDTLLKKQAEVNAVVERLKTEMLQVKGQMDEGAHHYQTLQDEDASIRDSLALTTNQNRDKLKEITTGAAETKTNMANLTARIDILEKSLTQARADLAAIIGGQAQEAAEKARKAAKEAEMAATEALSKSSTVKAEPETKKQLTPDKVKKTVSDDGNKGSSDDKKATAPPSSEPGSTIYDDALANFKSKNYKKAYIGFSDYIEKHPKGSMVANARFWLGDSLFNQNEFELAILEYQKVIADFPRHDKAAAALLKQGLAFEKLNDKETAKIVYYKLLDEYAKSDQAATARERVNLLKK